MYFRQYKQIAVKAISIESGKMDDTIKLFIVTLICNVPKEFQRIYYSNLDKPNDFGNSTDDGDDQTKLCIGKLARKMQEIGK